MQHHPIDSFRHAYCAGVALLLAGLGGACVFWPTTSAHLLPWALPPLHARCVGLMHLALAVELVSARREPDPAAARIPLASALAWAMAVIVAFMPARHDPAGAAWLVTALAVGSLAFVLLRSDREEHAPAQRADRAWLAAAAVALTLGALLLLLPDAAAAFWPWRMSAAQSAPYAPPFLAFGIAALMSARERRRYARKPALHALLALGLGVLAASTFHHAAFDPSRLATWAWFGAFAALTLLAAQRLRRHAGH